MTNFINVKTNGLKVIHEITENLKHEVDVYGEKLLERVCQIFVELAQFNLMQSGYDVSHFVDNIYYQKYGKNKYRVGIKDNYAKPIMYFLEFGTGFVGQKNPHSDAIKIGWEYLINPDRKKEGAKQGWTFYDENSGEYRFTSGLRAVSYIYDTLQQMPQIIEQAKKEVDVNG